MSKDEKKKIEDNNIIYVGNKPPMNYVTAIMAVLNSGGFTEVVLKELPESLGHAVAVMSKSDLVRETLGDHVFENLIHVKRKEWDAYRLQVTKWEVDNYLPLL